MRKILLLLFFVTSCAFVFAQDISKKFSATTQMFINERDGKLTLPDNPKPSNIQGKTLIIGKPDRHTEGRPIAKPDTINGVPMIAAFIRLLDNNDVSSLEAKGVIVQCKFNKGLVTALIPVDSIESVAGLLNVSRVNVASLMRPLTDQARKKTNVDDVLTHSADAVTAGLPNAYDGSGVMLGVIDTGIDFQHIAFKDASGNSRIKRAYVYNGSNATDYTTISDTAPTTDDSSEDHGTHTSSTAGGSSVIISGSNVTVTNDHSQATYGGMAPGTDLYLCGVNGLSNTYMANAFQKICDYADSQNEPCVVSNSWGGQFGPHDGTGDMADVIAQYFTDSKAGHICLFAASNDAGKSKDNEGGGYYLTGTATSTNPLGSILRSASYSNTDAGYFYSGLIANAWARSTSVTSMACKIFVLDTSTGDVLTSVTVTPSTNGSTVSGLSQYYSGTLVAYKDYISSDKTQILLYSSNGLTSQATSQTTKNGSTYYTSNYTLAVQFYPTSGSSIIDVWGGNYGYFTNYLTTSDCTWTDGSDDCCVSDDATNPNVISIGAYVSKNSVTDYNGSTYSLSSSFPNVGDIAYFSSYATATSGPLQTQYPWITAPGATIVSAVNAYHSTGGYVSDSYADYGEVRVNDNTTNPYGNMEGTSMATPCAAGIVALWLQAAKSVGHSLTTTEVKTIMKETAITDSYTTTGANASHFGNGKIDALAGIKYILKKWGSTDPTLTVTPLSLTLTAASGSTATGTFAVSGAHLTKSVTLNLTDADGVFSISPTTISAANAMAGATVTVTYSPTVQGASNTATVSVTSTEITGATTVTLNGSAPHSVTASAMLPITDKVTTEGETTTTTTTVFNEGFSGCNGTGGRDGNWTASGSSTIGTSNTDEDIWNSSNGFIASNCVRVGTGSNSGFLTTPSISGINGKTATLTFSAAGYDSGVTVNLTGTGCTLSPTSVSLTQHQFTDFTVTVTGTSDAAKIKFANTGKNKRFFIDDVKVTTTTTTTTPGTTTDETNYYGTCYVDFNAEIPSDITCYSAKVADDGVSTVLTQIKDGYIPAKTAFLIKSPTLRNNDITFADATSTAVASVLNNSLIGTVKTPYEIFNTAGHTYYILTKGNDGGAGFYYQNVSYWTGTSIAGSTPGSAVICYPNKAVLDLSTSGGAKSLSVGFGNTTGITNIDNNATQKDDAIYDITGRKVNNPTVPGIYS
jgi:hypothetical protein